MAKRSAQGFYEAAIAFGATVAALHYLLSSTPIRRAIFADATGTKVKHTSPDKILALEVLLPPLREQRKIAEILRAWDKAIENLEALHEAKNKRLSGLTQTFIGRGGAFPSRWMLRPPSAISTRVRRQNSGGNHPVMTISAKSGCLGARRVPRPHLARPGRHRRRPQAPALCRGADGHPAEALTADEDRAETADRLRSLIDRIELTPDASGKLTIDLYGDLAGILSLATNENSRPKEGTAGLAEQVKVVAAAGFEPETIRL
jgi:hypothetical protein